MTPRAPWSGFLLLLLASALAPGPLRAQTQKATGTVSSVQLRGFVLSQEVNAQEQEMTFSFGALLDDAIWFTQGDAFTIVTRDGKKVALKPGERVTVEYSVDGKGRNLVVSVRGAPAEARDETNSAPPSAATCPGPDARNVGCHGTGCQTLISCLGAGTPSAPDLDPDLLKKAQSGDAFAQYVVAGRYENRGDIFEAAKWCRRSAEHGEPHAQNALGILYQFGRGVPQSFVEAVAWFRKSAEQGDPGGESNLAKMFFDGTGVARDFAQAAEWYRKSADQGWAWAQAMLARMYAEGQGVAPDPVSAYSWCILAAPMESPQHHWGCKELLESLGSRMKPEEISEAKRRAYAWFEQRSRNPDQKHWGVGPEDEIGPSGVLTNEQRLTTAIGLAYSTGRTGARDDAEALKWFQLGAERGDAPAQSYLGEKYYLGQGLAKDPARAFTLFKQSAEQGYAYGQQNLAMCYLQGVGTQKEPREAAAWFKKAAEQGLAISQGQIAALYQNGYGTEKNEAEALRWYQKAVEQKDAQPMTLNNLAWLYATAENPALRNPAKALRYALRAVEMTNSRNAVCLDTLAEAYYVNSDYERAIQAESKAVALDPANPSYKQRLEKYQHAQAPKH